MTSAMPVAFSECTLLRSWSPITGYCESAELSTFCCSAG